MDPTIVNFFHQVDTDKSGLINATELQAVLQSSNGQKFSESCCSLMISLFSSPQQHHPQQQQQQIDINGFSQLYNYVNQWLGTFKNFDRNGSGFIDEGELTQALATMGYRFGSGFFQFIMTKYGGQQGLAVDGFISVCILIHKLTSGFRQKDVHQQGTISITYEEFLQLVMSVI